MTGFIIDSGNDIPKSILKMYDNIVVVPLKIILSTGEFSENEISEEKLLKFMETEFPKTSLPSYNDIINAFKKLIDKGIKNFVTVNISSGLSGTFNTFRNASNDVLKENPDVKIQNIDSKNIGIGSGLLAIKGLKMNENGSNYEEICNELNKIQKSKVFFTIPTLKYLKAGGRIGKVQGTIGDVLNIKPIITCNDDGIYHTISKSRGKLKALDIMLEKAKDFISSNKVSTIAICKSGESEETNKLIDVIKEKIQKFSFDNLIECKLSATLLCHTGEGLLGIGVILK